MFTAPIMIEESQTTYYLGYGGICLLMALAFIKYRSTEGSIITTREFQSFQAAFLVGHAAVMLSEFIAAASFYHSFISLKLSLQQVTKLYVATQVSSTIVHILLEVADVGARKDKCVLSALLYSVSMFSMFFGGKGHFEMLLMGRLVYGAAMALHHTAFDSYAVHQHTTLGFPDDWLAHTISLITHLMALMAALCGVVGQVASSSGSLGAPALCCFLFAAAAALIMIAWEKDLNSPRFMLSAFLSNMQRTAAALQSSRQMLALLAVSCLSESAILIFTFYWAPWLGAMVDEEDQRLPYEILFSCFIMASMLGNYLFQLYARPLFGSVEATFQALLLASSAAFFLGSMFQTPLFAFGVSIGVQCCIGGYWPSVGYFRGRVIVPELRNTALIIPR